MYADDAVLITDSEQNLKELKKEFNTVCKEKTEGECWQKYGDGSCKA